MPGSKGRGLIEVQGFLVPQGGKGQGQGPSIGGRGQGQRGKGGRGDTEHRDDAGRCVENGVQWGSAVAREVEWWEVGTSKGGAGKLG